MDLKGHTASDLSGSNARVRVWYEEEGVRTSYLGTVTKYSPAQGLFVWFDGMRRLEQEWVDGDDEWAWEVEPHVPGADALKLSAVRMCMRGPTISETMHMRLRGLPLEPPPPVSSCSGRSNSLSQCCAGSGCGWTGFVCRPTSVFDGIQLVDLSSLTPSFQRD